MPKTILIHQLGGPENLVIEDLLSRQPGSGEVKLRVEARSHSSAEPGGAHMIDLVRALLNGHVEDCRPEMSLA